MDCPHCDADVSEHVPDFGPAEKWLSCPECGGRVGCKTYYRSQGFTPDGGLPPGAMGMMQPVDGGVDIAVGNTRGNTSITGGARQINASVRANGEQATGKLLRRKADGSARQGH